jgi:hypothetical protein
VGTASSLELTRLLRVWSLGDEATLEAVLRPLSQVLPQVDS